MAKLMEGALEIKEMTLPPSYKISLGIKLLLHASPLGAIT